MTGLCAVFIVPFSIQKIDDCHQEHLRISLKNEIRLVLTGSLIGLIGLSTKIGFANYVI